MAKVELVHAMRHKLSYTDDGTPYWATVCGIRLAWKTERIATSEYAKSVTCPKCKGKK